MRERKKRDVCVCVFRRRGREKWGDRWCLTEVSPPRPSTLSHLSSAHSSAVGVKAVMSSEPAFCSANCIVRMVRCKGCGVCVWLRSGSVYVCALGRVVEKERLGMAPRDVACCGIQVRRRV